jgi:hypothetical protein
MGLRERTTDEHTADDTRVSRRAGRWSELLIESPIDRRDIALMGHRVPSIAGRSIAAVTLACAAGAHPFLYAFEDPHELRNAARVEDNAFSQPRGRWTAEQRAMWSARAVDGSADRLPPRRSAEARLVALVDRENPSVGTEGWRTLLANAHGHEALVAAARRGQMETVQALLAHGANPNHVAALPPAGGLTPLTAAVIQDDPLIVGALLRAGADTELPAGNRAAPLALAIELGRDRIAGTLIDAGADLRREYEGRAALWHAAKAGRAAVLNHLILRGENPNARDIDGRTPLHHAFEHKRADAVRLLLDRGADPQAIYLDRDTIFELLKPRAPRRSGRTS